jgi:cell division protease FtsH
LSLGPDDPNAIFAGPKIAGATAEKIDVEVLRLLHGAHAKAQRILTERRDLLDRLRMLLLVTETIDGTDLEAYATGTKPIPDPEAAREEIDQRAAAAVAAAPPPASSPARDQKRVPPITLPPAPPMPAD